MYAALRAPATSYAQSRGPGGVFGALGQLGGDWGWYALLTRNPIATRFSAWIWTDHGTVNLIVDTGKGRIPSGNYEVVTAGLPSYEWQELKKDGQHLSWVYTNNVGVSAVRFALSASGLASCMATSNCYAAVDTRGTLVA